MKNWILKHDVKDILANPSNIESIKKGNVSGASIEVVTKNPRSFESYPYYDKENVRDSDFEELNNLIKN
jgi:hypothetical protein